jgi:hypothetical protein
VGSFYQKHKIKNSSLMRRFLFVVILLTTLLSQDSKGQSSLLQFERLAIDISGLHSETAKHEETLIDSVFTMTIRDLLDFERLLGYKMSGQLHIRLFSNKFEYQTVLLNHPVWLERLHTEYLGISTNHYPVFVGKTTAEIHTQLRYILAHAALNEFLNGSSVRQKMTQSGFHQFPSWLFQGLCAQWANGWNIQAQDEYHYFANKGAFHSPNAIEPLAAQIFGRKIWNEWNKEFGDAALTNFWFILKYTGNANAAVEFLTGESFNDWYRQWKRDQKPMAENKVNTDFQIKSYRSSSPLINLKRQSQSNDFIVQFYIPDEEFWERAPINNAEKPAALYRKPHAKLLTECAYYLNSLEGFCKDQENEPSQTVKPLSFELLFQPIDAERNEISLVENINKDQVKIWTDTMGKNEIARDLIIESDDVISYIQSKDNQWYINFTKLSDTTIIRWEIPILGGFARQFTETQDKVALKVVESSFYKNQALLRWMDLGTLTPVEISEMLRLYPKAIEFIDQNNTNIKKDSLVHSTFGNPWTYLSPFPAVPNRKSMKTASNYGYNREKLRFPGSHTAFSLDKGGLYLSNEEPQNFANVATIDPNSLYNHPLTPEIRFYLSDPKRGHQLKAGLLSNLPMTRMAARIEQSWKYRKWELKHSFFHRSRDYYVRETTLFQNIGDLMLLGLQKNQNESLKLGIEWWYQRDIQFQKINRPFSNLKEEIQLRSHNLSAKFQYSFFGNHPIQAKRLQGQITGILGAHQYTTTLSYLKMGYDIQLIAECKQQLLQGIEADCKIQFKSSAGNVRNQYWVGGSQGWTNVKSWNLDYLDATEKANNFGYRMIGGYVRGFYSGERMGHTSAVLNAQISMLPYALLHQNLSKSDLLQHMKFYGFFDIGSAYIGKGIGDAKNPFNVEEIIRPNYRLDVFAKRNPWIAGTGFGISTEILRMPIRYEVAWGIKEGKISALIQYVCVSWNF